MHLRDLHLTASDLRLAGMLVSPIWLVLGIAAGDIVMILAAITAALVSTQHLKPVLVARLRDA